jgi:DNA-binding Lrp family transcriptional regulator
MLQRILNEFESAPGGISLNELGQRLSVERSALEGMITHLVRKGILRDEAAAAMEYGPEGSACASCTKHCPFAAVKMPHSYTLVSIGGTNESNHQKRI